MASTRVTSAAGNMSMRAEAKRGGECERARGGAARQGTATLRYVCGNVTLRVSLHDT